VIGGARTEVQAFRPAGGDILPSFGGQAGTEPARVYTAWDFAHALNALSVS
jgi:hypothetical protein